MKRLLTDLGIALLLAHGPLPAADLNVLGSTEVDPAALNFSAAASTFSQNINGRTYQRSPMGTLGSHQYAAYYDGNRNVCLARRRLPDGGWEVIRFTDHTITGNDSHNVVALGICAADGTIHLAFDHHADPLNYRVSAVGVATNPEAVNWSPSLFGPVTDRLGSLPPPASVTYPSFFNAPNGNLMFYYRSGGSGSGDGMLHEYDGTTRQWTAGMGKFIARTGSYTGALSSNSTSRNPYINGISYGGQRLHASWGWRESSGGAQFNHDLNYAWSDDNGRTWRNTGGTPIGTTGSTFVSIDSPGLVVAPIPENIGLSNQYTHYAYPDGGCHVIVSHSQSGTSDQRYHHYWRDAAGAWSGEVLPFSGSRPKLVGDDNRELFLAYTSGGLLGVAKGSPNPARSAWTWSNIHTESGRTEGGEGQLDATRWEAERILSVYGQVAPNSAGAPTALNVFDYQVSAKAILPVPADGQQDVEPSAPLHWTAGIGAGSHRIYLGTDPGLVAAATPSSPEYLGQQTAVGLVPAAPLAMDTTYYWRVDQVDVNSTVHQGLLWSFTTAARTLPGLPADAGVKENLALENEGSTTALLGTGGQDPWVDRCTVYVFQLPDLGEVADPFRSARLRFNCPAKQGTLKPNDLYGLGRRPLPGVLGGDYYGQTATADPTDATLLQSAILTDATPLGVVGTSPEGDAALVGYLNAQYDSGAGIGHYVFLRLNTVAAKSGVNRATLTMAEGGAAGPDDTRPRIAYTTRVVPVVTMVALGAPRNLTDGATWSDGLPAHAGASYVIPDTGNLRSEDGESVFPGDLLTVGAGGKFQARAVDERGETTTVDPLVLDGGASFAPGQFAELTAGTGNSVTNVLDGVIVQSGRSRFLSYGSSGGSTIDRSLKVLSRIEGSGRILVAENSGEGRSSVTIANPANSFSGVWELAAGSTLVFADPGAVGSASIEVAGGGRLQIDGDWRRPAALAVADSPGTEVVLGANDWAVSGLTYGGVPVADGVYTAADLNALGSAPAFVGSGFLTVGAGHPDGPVAHWKLDEAGGTAAGDSSGNGFTGSLRNGAGWGSDGTRASFAVFDGENDRIETPFTYALASGDDFTWTFWANQQSTGDADQFAVIVGNRYGATGPAGPKFLKMTPSKAEFANGTNSRYFYDVIQRGDWHHYAMVKDGGTCQWYVDGAAQGAPEAIAYDETSPIPFRIGGDDDGSGTKTGEHFQGFIDDVALYARALSALEVARVRDGIHAGFPEPTGLEEWRLRHFGSYVNAGPSADDQDPNRDGEMNLLEFATGQDPHAPTRLVTPVEIHGDGVVFRYTRSKAALADGFGFGVEWSDTLEDGSWSGAGVVDAADPENPDTPDLEFRKVTMPVGPSGRRFLHLRVHPP